MNIWHIHACMYPYIEYIQYVEMSLGGKEVEVMSSMHDSHLLHKWWFFFSSTYQIRHETQAPYFHAWFLSLKLSFSSPRYINAFIEPFSSNPHPSLTSYCFMAIRARGFNHFCETPFDSLSSSRNILAHPIPSTRNHLNLISHFDLNMYLARRVLVVGSRSPIGMRFKVPVGVLPSTRVSIVSHSKVPICLQPSLTLPSGTRSSIAMSVQRRDFASNVLKFFHWLFCVNIFMLPLPF